MDEIPGRDAPPAHSTSKELESRYSSACSEHIFSMASPREKHRHAKSSSFRFSTRRSKIYGLGIIHFLDRRSETGSIPPATGESWRFA
ncbi:hypothetical protein [Bradyrhizobium icense]|uniref:hypothetical protein n=1 Tax=Bradyrhizobium icense TaxID=1274631 RepID=UPI0012EA0703|nr:hypothetical protein [Bradyrhizobium icense]